MPCPEYTRLAALSESRRHAYTYIRLNEAKVHLSKSRYDELVKEGYDALTASLKDLGWHRRNCSDCKKEVGESGGH